MTMRERIERGRVNARAALAAYQETDGADPDEYAALGDLLADLLHLADEIDTDDDATANTFERAWSHYTYETDPANAEDEA